jgi:hypothetical protein
MAKQSNKVEIKPLIPCPMVSTKDYRDMTLSVAPGSDGDTEVVTIRIPVGTPVAPSWAKNEGTLQSGVLILEDAMIEIRGVRHWIRVNSGWKDGKCVGRPTISIVPEKGVPKTLSGKIAF